jgi:hypothetical protein
MKAYRAWAQYNENGLDLVVLLNEPSKTEVGILVVASDDKEDFLEKVAWLTKIVEAVE